jgi:nucleoside-diphosphate-sugar epimerase
MMRVASPDLDHILEQTRGLWDEMRGNCIFLIGGTGSFGCWLLESLLAANERFSLGASVTVLTRNPDAFNRKAPHLAAHSCVELITGDVGSFVLPDGEFRYVIHAATEAGAKQASEAPAEMFTTIVDGTRRALEFARHCGTRKFLLTSSGAVYGKHPPEISHIGEEYTGAPNPTDSRSVCGEGKRCAELLCSLYSAGYGVECKIARCFTFVGPHLPLDVHFAVADALEPGTAVRIAISAEPGRAPERYVPRTTKAEQELGLKEHVPLADAIRRTAAWLRVKENEAN